MPGDTWRRLSTRGSPRGSDSASVARVQDNPEGARRTSLIKNAPNEKFIGPDWIHFDVRERGWNEAIRSNTQLYELKPVSSER